MHPLGWVVLLLAFVEGGWLAFDGSRALIVGDYITPNSGTFAGQLGPWAGLVSAVGIEPRSTLMMAIHVVIGGTWLVAMERCCMDRGGDGIRPFPSGSVRRYVRTQAGRVRSLLFRTFWPTWISVICLEKLRDLSLGPMTLFHRPICVSIRLRWLYPVATCQAMRPLLRIWAIWRSRTVGSRADCGRITAFFGGGITTSRVSPYRSLSRSRVDAPS